MKRGKFVVAASILLISALVVGCGSSSGSGPTKKIPAPVVIHTNKDGIPIAPYHHLGVETLIVAYAGWKNPGSSFGDTGEMIEGKTGEDWVPISFIEHSLQDAGINTALQKGTLNLQVTSQIGVHPSSSKASRTDGKQSGGQHSLPISINGQMVGAVPFMKPGKKSATYVPMPKFMNELTSIHMKTSWHKGTGQYAKVWNIGSPFYGVVTGIISGDSGHFKSSGSTMTIVHKGNNWIPYDFFGNVLNNARAGITVNMLGNFDGLDILVPHSIPVNLKGLPRSAPPQEGEVPIEINHHVVDYARSMVPKFGMKTGYLSSAQVMAAIRRIGLSMHWNHTDGTFTSWTVIEPTPPITNG